VAIAVVADGDTQRHRAGQPASTGSRLPLGSQASKRNLGRAALLDTRRGIPAPALVFHRNNCRVADMASRLLNWLSGRTPDGPGRQRVDGKARTQTVAVSVRGQSDPTWGSPQTVEASLLVSERRRSQSVVHLLHFSGLASPYAMPPRKVTILRATAMASSLDAPRLVQVSRRSGQTLPTDCAVTMGATDVRQCPVPSGFAKQSHGSGPGRVADDGTRCHSYPRADPPTSRSGPTKPWTEFGK
jgi:hypothetical protein